MNIKRRAFLAHAGKIIGGFAGGVLLGPLSSCKKNPVVPGIPGNEVEVKIHFYSPMRGSLNYQMTKTGLSGDTFTFNIADLGLSGIDTQRIAFRKATGPGELVGDLVYFSKSGSPSPPFPEKDEIWEAFVFEGGVNYSLVEMDINGGTNCGYVLFREFIWSRLDEDVTGPEEPILEAIRQLAEVVEKPWKKYGTFNYQDGGKTRIGYSTQYGVKPVMFSAGWFGGDIYVYLDPNFCPTYEQKLMYFLREIGRAHV